MVTRNSGLLLSDAAQPVEGIQTGNVMQWYGGPLQLNLNGNFAGATVELMVCTRFPTGGDRADYADATKFNDADWVSMGAANAPGVLMIDNLNPCALALAVTGSAATTRVRATLS